MIAAYNEEAVIEERIRNALAMEYPGDRFKIVIGLDGCSDGTAAIVSRFEGPRVRVLEFSARRGKATVLNEAMSEVESPLVLMSDANTQIDPLAARRLARWFEDAGVGAVVGRLVLTDPRSGRNVDGTYWKYETFLKKCEGRLGALLESQWRDLCNQAGSLYPDSSGYHHRRLRHPLACQAPIGLHHHLRLRCNRPGGNALSRLRGISSSSGSEPVVFRASPCSGSCWIHVRVGSHSRSFPTKSCAGCVRSCSWQSWPAMRTLLDRPFFAWFFGARLGFYGVSLLAALAPPGSSSPRSFG